MVARDVEGDQNIRVGLKLTLDASLVGTHKVHCQWIERTGNLVDQAIATGAISNTARNHRLAWNLCAGFSGAVHETTILRGGVDLPTRIDDMLTAHLSAVALQ